LVHPVYILPGETDRHESKMADFDYFLSIGHSCGSDLCCKYLQFFGLFRVIIACFMVVSFCISSLSYSTVSKQGAAFVSIAVRQMR